MWSAGEAKWLNPDVIKPALKEKAKSNKSIRLAKHPFIIALFIEDFLYSVEEVVDAWFGSETVIIDVETRRILEIKRDRKGLFFYGEKITHRSISSTLVFKAEGRKNFRGRSLRGWYIENPYANVKVDASIFPVEASYTILEKDAHGYKLGWIRRKE